MGRDVRWRRHEDLRRRRNRDRRGWGGNRCVPVGSAVKAQQRHVLEIDHRRGSLGVSLDDEAEPRQRGRLTELQGMEPQQIAFELLFRIEHRMLPGPERLLERQRLAPVLDDARLQSKADRAHQCPLAPMRDRAPVDDTVHRVQVQRATRPRGPEVLRQLRRPIQAEIVRHHESESVEDPDADLVLGGIRVPQLAVGQRSQFVRREQPGGETRGRLAVERRPLRQHVAWQPIAVDEQTGLGAHAASFAARRHHQKVSSARSRLSRRRPRAR